MTILQLEMVLSVASLKDFRCFKLKNYGCAQLPGGGERCSMAVLHVTVCSSEFFLDTKLTQESLELRYET